VARGELPRVRLELLERERRGGAGEIVVDVGLRWRFENGG